MPSKYHMAMLSAILNLIGAALIFWSFQAASTKLLLVTGQGKDVAFCIGDRAMFGLTKDGQGLAMGYACPSGDTMKPTVVANTDKPWMATVGWGMLVLGFVFQLASVEKKPKPDFPPRVSYGPRQKSPKISN